MDKKILIIFLIAIVAFSISCVSAADSNEIVMNSSDAVSIGEDVSVDDGAFANPVTSEDSQVVGDPSSEGVWVATTGDDTNDGSQANPVASVSKAVDLAQSGSTIHIKEGTYNQGKISLNKTLSFVGEGKVILNSNGANVFACEKDGYNLEFTNLVFTGVSSTAGTSCGLKVGGNGNLKVINCTFTDISAKYGAMQLYTTGVADIINSTIKDVVSGTSNGCIVYISGSGTYNFNNLSIINPKLADSVVAGSPYAFLRNVFYSYGKEATVTLTNSIITGASGPIQAVVESRGKLTIYNTVISNNVVGKTTTSYGKYLLYVGEVTALNMTNCIIENNTFADSSSALIYFNSACKANITYSSIVDNGFSKNVDVKSGITPTVNLDYNWWGTNTYTGDNVNKWVVMSTPETTINAESGKAIDVSVNFNHYTDASGSIQDLAQSISGINVDFSAVSGTLSKNNVASVDGIATVTYTTTTNDKITAKSGSQSLTIDVTVSSGDDNVVTKETFFNFFDSEGNLLDSITYDTLIFKGEFSNLGINVITISKPLTINGNNAVLKNIGFAIVSGDVTLNGLTLAGNTLSEEIEGSVININDVENVMLSNLNIDYSSVSNDLDIALIKCVQSANVELVDSNIKYVGNKIEEGLTNYVIYVDTCPNMVIKGNTITASLYPHNINFGDIIDSAAIYVEAGVIGDSINLTNNTISIDVLASDIKKGAVYGLYSAYSESYLNDNTIVLTNKNEGYCKVYAVYSQPGVVSEFNNILINASSNGIADGIYGLRVTVENTNVTIVSNGPAVGINSISGKNVIKNSKINVTGLATNTDSVLGITFEKMGDLIGNSIYVHNMGKYSDDNLIYGIFSTKDTKSNIKNNEITSEGNYAIYLSRASDSNITDNILYAHELKGNDAVNVIGTNNIIKDNKPITVTDVWVSASGSDDNDGSQDNPVATIAKAIELVAEGYTIHVGEGTYIANSLTIAKSFAIIGSGKVIIDGNASKIMNINENTIVNFTNVAFTNALNNYGGVMQSKGTVNLNNVSIYKNTQKSGSTPTVSSIYNTGVMTIINSNIYENDGYGLIFNSGNLDIINTTISSNNVAKGTTYAFLYADGGIVNVINSTISDNAARLAGIWLNKGTLNVNNATFENNVVTVGNGGAIHIESDSSTATIKDSKFIGNKANKDGGAIYNKGTLNIETSIFDANAASNGNTGYHGDDIYNSGILTLHYSALLGKGTNKLIYNEGREPSANAQYNWWGTNSNPSTLVGAGLDYDDEPCDDVDVSNWVVMSVDPASIEKVIVGNEKTLTVNFNHYNANGVIKELAKSIPSINVNFEAVNGTLSSDVVATDNGVASVTYTVKGNDQITVKSGSQTLTVPVTTKELTNIVTNETFFIYFDEDGLLREEVPFDELVFKGEFSNLVNLISIEKPLKITSDNAVLRNIAFAVLSDNVVLNGLTLISNVSCDDNGGTLILVAGNNVNITDMNISYIIKESVDAVAINANGVSNLNVVNSNIFFEACPKDDTLTACAINMEGVSNSFIDGNNITAVLPYLFASNYDYTYFMMGVNTVNPIRMRECTNVTFSKNNVNTTANDGSASFPTLQCMFIVGSKDCVIDGNNFSMIDTVIPAGTSNYLYGINIGYNKNLMISNNDFKMSTAGGKDAAGTAYAIQGVECEVSMIGNNITSVSNGPNLGIYFASMSGGTSELYIANNLINVTGLASASGSWALVSGIEVQNGNAKIYNNTIYTYNVGAYNPGNYMYGISYAQYMYGDRSFDVRNNTVYVDGHYAVSFLNANNCNVTDNFLITRDLAGDAAVEIKAGKNNVVENNYPRSSDLIFNITSEEPGKILINVTIDKKATGNMTIKVNGEEYTVTIVDGSASLTLDNLDNGTYFIESAYGGNTFITESSNSTFFNLGLIESSIVLNVSDIKVGQDAIITANITDGATGTVTFFVNGNSYLVFIENGTATLKVSDLTPGDYSVFAQYNGDKQYTISSNSTVFNVAKLSSKVAINVNNIKVGQDATIRLTLPNVNSGVVSVIVNGKTYNVNIVNTKGTLTVSNLANGTYTVIAKFEGNDMYAASEANTTFSVSKIASTTTVSVSDINATQDAVINIAVPGIASGVVSVTVGDAIYSVAVVDGKGSLTVSGLAAGSYDVVAKFAETDMYLASEANATFSVSKLASTITVAVGDIDATHDAIVNVEVPNVDLGSVTVTIGKTSYNVAIIDGKGTLNVPNLDGATYDVVAKFNGNDKYLASENTTKFTVSKIASNIVVYVKDIDVDGLLVFDAFVSQGATGSVFFRKGLTEVGNHIIDGRATVRWGYMSTAGTYTFEVRYAGDGKFLPFYSTVSANVNKIASSVSVNVNDINVGENAIIYATVSPSGVAGDVKLTIDNKTYTEKISDGVVKFTIPNLTAGKHEISVTYAGNYKYLSSTSSTSINVSRFDSTTHVSVNDINAGENAVINIAVSNGTSGVASVRVGDMSYNVAVVDGKGTLTLSNLIAKSYDVVVKFEGNDVYLPSQDATKFTVSKIVSATNITVSDINVGDDAVIDIAVSNVTSGVISVRVDNTVYNVVIVDGKGTLVVSNLAAGYYTVVAKFAENDIYLASMDTVRFTVSKLASTITVNVSNINVGEDAVISIAVPEVTSGVASVTVNGKSYNVAVVDGKGTLVVSNLAAGYYTVVAKFAENDIYLASMDTVRFTVSKLASTITVNVSNINVGEDAVISIAVPEVTSGVASVTVNGKSYNVAVVDGKGSLIVSGLAAGSYDVVAKFAETDMYLASENSAKFTVSKLVISSMDVDVKDIKVGDDAVISVALPEDATGNVTVNINGKNYTAVVKYGVASVTVPNLANGTYSVSVFYNGDDTYMPMENSTKFTVSKVSDYNMTVDIADIIKGENATITVTVPKDGTGSVVVTINGTDYKGTVTNGTAKVIIPGLDEGTYKVVTFYTGDAKYDSMIVNGTITVNKNTKTTLTMDDVVKYFKGAQNLTAKLVDAFGNPITNATVYFTVNGKVYAKTTDKNGTASMGIGLVPNEYKVNAVFNGTKDYDKATANATVTVKNTVFGNDTTLYFCNGTKYVAKFLDSNGKALANTTVKFNINGVFYTRVTDENGTASLGIRLDPKSYVITAYNPATGEERANNITVLPRLTAQDLSMKYLDGSTFNATLVDGQGKALAGANITFNVNGVFYHKTTNANGVASLNIRLMAGEYIITSMYDNCWASNKITISA